MLIFSVFTFTPVRDLLRFSKREFQCEDHRENNTNVYCFTCSKLRCCGEECRANCFKHNYQPMTDATHANLRQMLKYMQQAEAKNRDYAKAREEVEKAEARLERDLVSTKDAIDEAAEYFLKQVTTFRDFQKGEAAKVYSKRKNELGAMKRRMESDREIFQRGIDFIKRFRAMELGEELILFRKYLVEMFEGTSKAFCTEPIGGVEMGFLWDADAIKRGTMHLLGRVVPPANHMMYAKEKLSTSPEALKWAQRRLSSSSLGSSIDGLSLLNTITCGIAALPSPTSDYSEPTGVQSGGYQLFAQNGAEQNGAQGIWRDLVSGGTAAQPSGDNQQQLSIVRREVPPANLQSGSDFQFDQQMALYRANNQLPSYNHRAIGPIQPPSRNFVIDQFQAQEQEKTQDVFSRAADPVPGLDLRGDGSVVQPQGIPQRERMEYTEKFGEFGNMCGQFTEPNGVAVTPSGDIIVCDTNNHRLQVFDRRGSYKFEIFMAIHPDDVGRQISPQPPPASQRGNWSDHIVGCFPNRVAVRFSNSEIVVTERYPHPQVKIFDHFGNFQRKFGVGLLEHPRALALDRFERVVVVESKVMRVWIFEQDGTVLRKLKLNEYLDFPNGLAVSELDELLISDNRKHCVKVFDYDGNMLRHIGAPGFTNYPIGVVMGLAGEVIVADNHNNFNITIFTLQGDFVRAFESKVKHAQCFDIAATRDGHVVLASKDYRVYVYSHKGQEEKHLFQPYVRMYTPPKILEGECEGNAPLSLAWA